MGDHGNHSPLEQRKATKLLSDVSVTLSEVEVSLSDKALEKTISDGTFKSKRKAGSRRVNISTPESIHGKK